MMVWTDVVWALNNGGVPLLLAIGIWRVMVWTATKITTDVIPHGKKLVDGHLDYLSTTAESIKVIAIEQLKQNSKLDEHRAKLDSYGQKIDTYGNKIHEIHTNIVKKVE